MRVPAEQQPHFARLVGVRITHRAVDLVQGELDVTNELGNGFGILHGGALMTFADNLAGTATAMNLRAGDTASTIESKTNFFAAVQVGDTARGEARPLHIGRTTMVWESRIWRGDGRLAAVIVATQLIMPAKG
jgi:1,4-dihydroxy-2-naphthoyl-CoA hydrolase